MNLIFIRYRFLIVCLMVLASNIISAQEQIDWNNYHEWKNTTKYSKTYVVNQRHTNASDNNPGTEELPLLTINEAAQRVKAGERVLIYAGVYREFIQPNNSGEAEDRMISFEAASGERVIVKGSRILNVGWERNMVLTDEEPEVGKVVQWSKKLWSAELPNSLFENDYFPFKLKNIEDHEYEMMPWAVNCIGKSPWTLRRGLLFQNGRRLQQLESYGDLTRLPGSFWISNDNKTLYVHPYDRQNPNSASWEITTQSHLLKPKTIGIGYIQVRGISFKHCGNSFLRTSTGAICINGGHHWIIEDCKISSINSSGIEMGYYAYEFEDKRPENIQPREDEDLGGVIIRNNEIFDCGTAGIRSYTVTNGLLEGNHIYNCGWQDAENYWECGGIKLLRAKRTLVCNNYIHHIQGGNAIWLDWDNRYSRATGNLIHDIQTIQGGIFVEASQYPNLVDNNFIWNVDGNGIYLNDSDETLVAHNLVAKTTGPIVRAVVATSRTLNGRKLSAERNRIVNNIFIDGGQSIMFSSESNYSDFNLYISTNQPENICLKTWQKMGYDINSIKKYAAAEFVPQNKFFYLLMNDVFPRVASLQEVTTDFYGNIRKGKETVPGPFAKYEQFQKILLN
ncbi:parallel beta-helix repeat (two copies) [Mariniphaga anaerophila]|uniref:Parallel beta-helix repeat (Two copies) n=1 Tax=Mariniphaga anaerophila TaxID=1484053 RepID=A0A1M4U6N5_9BACT|nr:right-handed parallel beta-helix repeat-containing protein [Mariniphaga anaerophila]SHE52308.1 parallel beta-helix repeat (two copies) [Mariniphaga anaerophila]